MTHPRDPAVPELEPPTGPGRFTPDFLTELFRNPLDPGYADAAAARSENGPVPARRQRVRKSARLILLGATGFLLAVAYQQAVAAEPEAARARTGLINEVKDRQAESDALQRQADLLRQEVSRARDAALGRTEQAARLRDLETAAGLVPVRGDGVVVTLTDAPTPVDPVTGRPLGDNPGKVLDRDLQDVANELWAAGAEAVAINGERLTATSTIRAAGGAILVDFHPVTGPYQVAAIGAGSLAKRFSGSPTGRRFARYVSLYRMGFSVKGRDNLVLPAGTQTRLRAATPLGTETK
jgi:uncharacterized protein YlxW (UPF0749 family)